MTSSGRFGHERLPVSGTRLVRHGAPSLEFLVCRPAVPTTGAPVLFLHGAFAGALSSIAALSKIVAAAGDKIEITMDGSIRTGQDALRALALGARSVFVGRAFLYGLAAGGEAGVAQSLGFLRNELDTALAMRGLEDVRDVGPHILHQVT